MMHIGDTQVLRDLEMHPASSRSLISSLTKVLYFKGLVFHFVKTGGPIVGRSIFMMWFAQNLWKICRLSLQICWSAKC